jgi:hypothetical protein
VFSRIRDHEEIAEKGEDPLTVLKARRTGTFVDDDGELADAVNRKSTRKEATGKGGDDEYPVQEGEELVEGRSPALELCIWGCGALFVAWFVPRGYLKTHNICTITVVDADAWRIQ